MTITKGRLNIVLVVAFFSLRCESLDATNPQESERKSLNQRKLQILEFINSYPCREDSACSYVPFGSKPCGGPWTYLAYPKSIDTSRLFVMIREYNNAEHSYNKKWGMTSDCSIPPPPDSVRCLNGKCTPYYFGVARP